jgi:hypothetical protein
VDWIFETCGTKTGALLCYLEFVGNKDRMKYLGVDNGIELKWILIETAEE